MKRISSLRFILAAVFGSMALVLNSTIVRSPGQLRPPTPRPMSGSDCDDT